MNRTHLVCRNAGIVIRPVSETSASVWTPRGKRLPAILALVSTIMLGASPAAWAGAGGVGGTSFESIFVGGDGGSTSITGPTAGSDGTGPGNGVGGAAGTSVSPTGGTGQQGIFVGGGGGGGGGYAGLQTTGSMTNASGTTLTGGNGGLGGEGFDLSGGGGGGAGGYGAAVTAATGTSTNAGMLTGGTGGAGGSSDEFTGGGGGQGGNGIGIAPTSATTFINTGTITGGAGGNGGNGGNNGIGGAGGNGGIGIEVEGDNVTIINSGAVSGGAGGAGNVAPSGATGYAIQINGNNNTLVLEPGSVINDYVSANGTNNTLALSGTGTATFDTSEVGVNGQYKNFDSITKTGSSNWTLIFGNTDDSTPWTVEAGTITVDATNAFGLGNVTQTGGTITTTGTGGMQIAVAGNYIQNPGGTLALHIASATTYDTLTVTGTATLSGTLTLAFAGGYTPTHGQQYTLITTTGGINPNISSSFLNPVTNLAALKLTATGALTDSDHDLTATITATQLDFTGLFGGNYLTPNEKAVASNIDGSINRNTSGNFGPLVTALDNVSSNHYALSAAFDQLMPLNFARFGSSTAFNNTSFLTQQMDDYLANHRGADGSFLSSAGGIDYSGLSFDDGSTDSGLQQIHSRLLAWNPAPSTGLLDDSAAPVLGGVDMKDTKRMTCNCTLEAPQMHLFVAGDVVLGQDFSDANASLAHDDTTTGAMQLGVDYAVTPHLLVGALFGFGHTDADLDDIGSTASVDTYSPGVYASYSDKGWYANALASYGFSNYTQHRNIQIGGLDGTAQSNPDGDQIIGNLDGGYDFHDGNLTFGPTAGVQYVHLEIDSYNEYGLPAADLNVNDDQADSLRSRVGGQVSYAMRHGGVVYTPHLAASWQHEFLDQERGITSQFDSLGAGSFVVRTQSPSRDSALLDTGLDAEIDKTITVFANYTVQAGQSNYFGQSVQAGVKVGF